MNASPSKRTWKVRIAVSIGFNVNVAPHENGLDEMEAVGVIAARELVGLLGLGGKAGIFDRDEISTMTMTLRSPAHTQYRIPLKGKKRK